MNEPERVVCAPNAFKGCLTAAEAAREIAAGVRRARPRAATDLMPISDGGDGLVEVLLGRFGGKTYGLEVTGPFGLPRRASYAVLEGGRTAVIEMARASGIAGEPKALYDPLGATSFGVGELIADALGRGARRVVVGMGGSATNDGGAGMGAALGAELLDEAGELLPRGAAVLLRLAQVKAGRARRLAGGVEVLGVSDVCNPLLGPKGSARVYGPQKGATPEMVAVLERALARYAKILRRDVRVSVADAPMAGAAGGLGAGLKAFLGAKLVGGADWVLRELGAAGRVQGAALALTGEGRLDSQSFFGKAPVALARLAKTRRVPRAFLCGAVERAAAARARREFGPNAVFALSRPGERPEKAVALARPRLRAAAEAAARALLAVLVLCVRPAPARAQEVAPATGTVVAGSPGAVSIEEADFRYFHRHQGANLDLCLGVLESLQRRGPDDPQVLWRLGRALDRLGESKGKKAEKLALFKKAEAAIRRSIELDPRNAEAHFWLGLAMGRRGQTQGVFKSLFLIKPIRKEMKAALELDPGHGGAHHVLGEMLRQIPGFAGGSKKGALAEFEKAAELSPNYLADRVALARAYIDAGEKEKAKAVLKKALEVKEPADPGEYDDNMAEVGVLLESLRR